MMAIWLVISYCSFDLHLSNNEQCWAFFHVFVSHLYVFFGEMPVQVFSPLFDGWFVFLALSCMSCLYILEINPLSVVSFAIIFSHSAGCLFSLLIVSFAVQQLLSLIRSDLFTFVFISITLGGGSQRILLWFMSSSVLPMFSSESFIVSGMFLFSVHLRWLSCLSLLFSRILHSGHIFPFLLCLLLLSYL